jgi:hypothetical protein
MLVAHHGGGRWWCVPHWHMRGSVSTAVVVSGPMQHCSWLLPEALSQSPWLASLYLLTTGIMLLISLTYYWAYQGRAAGCNHCRVLHSNPCVQLAFCWWQLCRHLEPEQRTCWRVMRVLQDWSAGTHRWCWACLCVLRPACACITCGVGRGKGEGDRLEHSDWVRGCLLALLGVVLLFT